MITRGIQINLEKALLAMPVVALLGPRQVGKTTLALQVAENIQKKATYLDLESDADSNKLSDAEAFLKRFDGELLILDEVHRMPELFRILRGIVDARKRNGEKAGMFLLLGSASRDLLQNTSETLAGRIRYLEMCPFYAIELSINQNAQYNLENHWVKGGFPDSYLAETDAESMLWRSDFIATYMERDLPLMGVGIAPQHLKRFWKMLAHYHGNQINYSELGRSLELSHTTIKHYLDTMTDFYMVRQLLPFAANVKKRLVKTPKVYLRDTGILHSLLNLSNLEALFSYPAMGASWEGFVIENILNCIDQRWEYYYYRTATQVEIDLVLITPDKEIWAIEIKRNSAPKPGRGFTEACNDIQASKKWIVNASDDRYPLSNNIEVIGIMEFLKLLHKLT
jgi:predicted AAA+ superfamily ATPase